MPLLETKYCGKVPVTERESFEFPEGLPGFRHEKAFTLIKLPGKDLLLLQSMSTRDLCFPALSVSKIDPDYELAVPFEDLKLLGLETERQPVIGTEVGVLAVLTVREGGSAEANLLAPVVINLANRRGVQSVRFDSRYPHAYPICEVGGRSC